MNSARNRPIVAFYVICFVVTWGLWLPLILTGGGISELFAVIGLFGGPGLACIVVARIAPPAGHVRRRFPFWIALLGAWVPCALILVGYQLETSPGVPLMGRAISALLAFIPAFILASALAGTSGVRTTLASLVRPGGRAGWYALALFLPAVMRIVSVCISEALGWQLLTHPQSPPGLAQLAGSVLMIFLYTLIYAGGLNEEIGWTGFALPRMLSRFSPFVSTVFVWGLWMLWHVPLHLSGLFDLNLHVLVGSFFGRFLITWVFIRTSGGMLSAMLLHTSVNVTSQLVPVTNASLLVDAAAAVLVVVGARMWRRLPPDNPAAFTAEKAPT